MLYVLACPEFEPDITQAVARFRAKHEPERASLVRPHVTLVFGVRDVTARDLATHCASVAKTHSPIAVGFSAGEIGYDPYEKTFKLMLRVSDGAEELMELHEALRYPPLQQTPTRDTPYRPHMTVATDTDRSKIDRLDPAAIAPLPFFGIINTLDVVEITGNALHDVESVPLGK